MGFFSELREGIGSVTRASRLVSSSVSLWLWLYVAVTLLSVAGVLSPAIGAATAVGRDPYLWSGRVIPWVEPLFFGASEHTWLGVSSIAVLFSAWVFGWMVYAGIAGAMRWKQSANEATDKRSRSSFGSAAFKYFGTSLFYYVMLALGLVLVMFLGWIAYKVAPIWVVLVVASLGLLWFGVLVFWRALALAVRVRGRLFSEAFSSSISFIWRNPIRVVGALMPIFINALVLIFGMIFLLRYSLTASIWLILLQQLWVFAYLGHKILIQATAELWVNAGVGSQ
jgi:hypothetical protein